MQTMSKQCLRLLQIKIQPITPNFDGSFSPEYAIKINYPAIRQSGISKIEFEP